MRCSLLKTVNRGRWSGTLDYLDRIVVFARTIGAAFVALLLEKFLGFSVCEAEEQLHTIFGNYVMKFR